MRRWDRSLDSYIEEYRARGVSPQSVAYTEALLHRWGRWLKGRRPRVGIERIDAEMITRYMANCSSFRAKATVYATRSVTFMIAVRKARLTLGDNYARQHAHWKWSFPEAYASIAEHV